MSPLALVPASPAPWLAVEGGAFRLFMTERGFKLHFFRAGEVEGACNGGRFGRVRAEEAKDPAAVVAGERPVACRPCVEIWARS